MQTQNSLQALRDMLASIQGSGDTETEKRLTLLLAWAEGEPVSTLCRNAGISRSTFYRWVEQLDLSDPSSLKNRSKRWRKRVSLSTKQAKNEYKSRVICSCAFCRFVPLLSSWWRQHVKMFLWILFAVVFGIGVLVGSAPTRAHASSWDPTLLVNTEAFHIIDEGDGATDVSLQFGDALAETLTFNRTDDTFSFSDDVFVAGDIEANGSLSGKTLTLSSLPDCATLGTSSTGSVLCRQASRAQFQENTGGYNMNGAGTAVPWDTQIFIDTGITHTTGVNPSRIYLDEAGQYLISYSISHEAQTNARKNVRCRARMNGVTDVAYSASYSYSRDLTDEWATNTASFYYETSAPNEYFEIVCAQEGTAGGAFTVAGESWTYVNALGGVISSGPSRTTLDSAYNNDSGERTVTVDAGDISFDLTGANQFIIDTQGTGNVGIGTDAPTADLEVVGTVSGSSTLTLSQYKNCAAFTTDADGNVVCASAVEYDSVFVNVSGDTMTGDLSIANGAKLSVSGSITTADNLIINADNEAVDAVLTFGNSIAQQALTFANADALFAFSTSLTASGNVTAVGTLSGNALTVSSLKNCVTLFTDESGNVHCAGGGYISVTSEEESTTSSAMVDLFADASYPGTFDYTLNASGGILYTPATGRFTITHTGAYLLSLNVIVEVDGNTNYDLLVAVDGVIDYQHNVYLRTFDDPRLQSISYVRELNAGQYVQFGFDSLSADELIAHDGTTASISIVGGGSTGGGGGGGGSSGTLDDAYNAGTGERTVTVDSGDISFDLTGANQFIIDTQGTGNVGIGTGSPDAKLAVAGSISGSSLAVAEGVSRGGFFYAYDTVAVTTLGAGVYTTIDNDQIVVNDTNFYSEAAGVVTIQRDGLYRVDAKCGLDLAGGTREFARCAIHRNGAIQNNLSCSMYGREIAGVSGTSCAMGGLMSLSATDTVDLRYNPDTTNADPDDNEQSLMLEFVQ